jgi:hypothetical protein
MVRKRDKRKGLFSTSDVRDEHKIRRDSKTKYITPKNGRGLELSR